MSGHNVLQAIGLMVATPMLALAHSAMASKLPCPKAAAPVPGQ